MATKKRRGGRLETIEAALDRVEQTGGISLPERYSEKVWIVGDASGDRIPFPYGAESAALELMERLPGFMTVTEGGLSLVQGRAGTVARVVPRAAVRGLEDARQTYREITGLEPDSWSVAGVARDLLTWAARSEFHTDEDEKIMPPDTWHHQSCNAPGRYMDVVLHDVSGYYWQLLRRLRDKRGRMNPRFRFCNNRPWFDENGLTDAESERWQRMVEGIGANKSLRNTIVGCMAGGDGEFLCVSSQSGARMPYTYTLKKQKGPFRAAGLWIVATGNELTHRQALTDGAIYANIDCVVLRSDTTLSPVWQGHGLPVSAKCRGRGDICHIGSWRIGREATKPYNAGERARSEKPLTPKPPVRYAGMWL